MLVYLSDKSGFRSDIEKGVLEDKIQKILGHKVSDSEKQSWSNSLLYMNMVLENDSIPDNIGIGVELKIPKTAKRIDVVLSGKNNSGYQQAVIVELKQWSSAEATKKDDVVKTYLGGALREVAHPSYQAWSYASLLRNFNEAAHDSDIGLNPCAFLHNYPSEGILKDPRYGEVLARAPLFAKGEIARLRQFIIDFISVGDGGKLILDIREGKIRPSKRLSDQVASMLKGNEEFVMVDDQKVAFESILSAAPAKEKTVVIVHGGPGTGKSVVAINLLARMLQRELFACYVTKNSAPREVYAAKLSGQLRKTEISNLFLNSGKFTATDPDMYDVLLVDEAHRLNEKSGLFGNLGEHQIKEIIQSSRLSVFFLDEDQRVTLKDIGSRDEIIRFADEAGAQIQELKLESQFRCNGQDGYLAWLDDILQIRQTTNETLDGVDFDFKVIHSPNELFELVRDKNELNNRSRVVAGYCWPWKSKKDPRAWDIEMDQWAFRRQWNLTKDGMLWLIEPKSIEQVGCIHTCQGLELDYVGVILGPDLLVRNGRVICHPEQRAPQDRSVFGWKKMMKQSPDSARPLLDTIIKNTYRTLMTRGMKGYYVFSVDEETRWYLQDRVGNPATNLM